MTTTAGGGIDDIFFADDAAGGAHTVFFGRWEDRRGSKSGFALEASIK
jgi:hypothetical protein